MESVYIETTVVGNVAGKLYSQLAIADRQQATREWWLEAPRRYRLFTSQVTVDECGDGDPAAASERLEVLRKIELLDITDAARELARLLMTQKAVPTSQPRDALHIAVAAAGGVGFIATWNFKHILNPHLQRRIASVCRDSGFNPPVICTPQQLLESDRDS